MFYILIYFNAICRSGSERPLPRRFLINKRNDTIFFLYGRLYFKKLFFSQSLFSIRPTHVFRGVFRQSRNTYTFAFLFYLLLSRIWIDIFATYVIYPHRDPLKYLQMCFQKMEELLILMQAYI